MEQEIDVLRHKGKITIDQLKRKVNYIWNRIPKKLCSKVVNKFNDLVKTVYENKGNKENRKNRKEKKKLTPCVSLKTKHRFINKFFGCYGDDIKRIAYSEKTLKAIRKMYQAFLKTEIVFYKKVIQSIQAYNRKCRSTKKGVSNLNVDDYCSTSIQYIENINVAKEVLLEGIEVMDEDKFWELFSDKVKENLVCNETLTNRSLKIENLIANNPHDQNLTIFNIINKVRDIEFDGDKDVEAFYNKIKAFIKNESATTTNTLTAADTSEIDIISDLSIEHVGDNESVGNEAEEEIFIDKKRKRK